MLQGELGVHNAVPNDHFDNDFHGLQVEICTVILEEGLPPFKKWSALFKSTPFNVSWLNFQNAFYRKSLCGNARVSDENGCLSPLWEALDVIFFSIGPF